MAIKVKLREKKITGNRNSLYLDFYPPIPHPKSGKPTRREFLGLYIFEKPKSSIDKDHNKETKLIASSIRQLRENELNKPEIYSEFEKKQLKLKKIGEENFISYFLSLAEKRRSSNYDNWMSTFKHLTDFTGEKLKFSEITEHYLEEFKDYLLNKAINKRSNSGLSTNSAVSYFNKVKASLKQAYKDGKLQVDLNSKISSIKPEETRREFLTIDELNTLVKTPCANDNLKKAALFSALTGIRFSDIQKMTWSEFEFIEEQGYFFKFRQKKTKAIESHPVSDQAFNLLGKPGELKCQVLKGLKYSAYNNKLLQQWIIDAGITKHITFHCFRHTYAILQLSYDTNLYTIQKLLGHKNIKTTQIYAKVLDSSKRQASDKIKLNF